MVERHLKQYGGGSVRMRRKEEVRRERMHATDSDYDETGVEVEDTGTGDVDDTGSGDVDDTRTGDVDDTGTGDVDDTGTGDVDDTGTGEVDDTGTFPVGKPISDYFCNIAHI